MKISGGGDDDDESVGVRNGSESGDSAIVSERGSGGVQIGISSAIREVSCKCIMYKARRCGEIRHGGR